MPGRAAAPAPCDDRIAIRRAYRARRGAERVAGVYVMSLSFLTVTYKALCAAGQLARFFRPRGPGARRVVRDLPPAVPTNTSRAGSAPQPFRLLCHNGEINTIDGNVAWMEARDARSGSRTGLAPALDPAGPTPRFSTTRWNVSSTATGSISRRPCRLFVPPAWQTIRASSPRYVTFIGTGHFSASLGTGRRPCAPRTAAHVGPHSTGTAFDRYGWQ